MTRDFQQSGILTSADSDEPVQPPFQGITVRLGTVSVGAIGFMSIRNKYGRTLVNPNFCSADTWS